MTNRDKLDKMTNEDAVKEYYDKIVCPQCDLQDTEECKTCTGKGKLINWLSQEAELTADEMFEE